MEWWPLGGIHRLTSCMPWPRGPLRPPTPHRPSHQVPAGGPVRRRGNAWASVASEWIVSGKSLASHCGLGCGDSNSGPPLEGLPDGGCAGRSDLRFLRSRSDRSDPLHSTICRLRMYPPCTGGLRSRLVAEASGAPVLPNQGPIGRPGTVRPIQALIMCTVGERPKGSRRGRAPGPQEPFDMT
jgi:hypothetical protein